MTTAPIARPPGEAAQPAPAAMARETRQRIDVAVHDASRLAWHVAIPLPKRGRAPYAFELELEAPSNVVGVMDSWAALQSYTRLDVTDDADAPRDPSLEAFRRSVVVVSSRLARARDGFVRHCTLMRSSAIPGEDHARALILWIHAARSELASARARLLGSPPRGEEGVLADEFLSGQLWTVLTDFGRALFDARRALEERAQPEPASLSEVESELAGALREELTYRKEARFVLAEPVNASQLERLVSRMRWLKKHFERVLFLDVDSYQVVSRLAGWLSALTAMLAYLWFLAWQLTLERHPIAIGSGAIAFALVTAVAYASRERLKEVGRNWLAGRVQRVFAQRVTHGRLPARERQRAGSVVVSARESFSQSTAQRPDPVHPECGSTHDVTVLRFIHRGLLGLPEEADGRPAREVRHIYRLDLSALFPRLHDAVRGLALIDERTGALAIVDVPRNYELPVRARLRCGDGDEATAGVLVLNKNGLLRFVESAG